MDSNLLLVYASYVNLGKLFNLPGLQFYRH